MRYLLILLLALSAYAQTLDQLAGKRIGQIVLKVDGMDIAEAERQDLLATINLQAGEPLAIDKIRRAVLRLYRLGKIAEARVSATTVSSSVVLLFELKRQLVIKAVKFDSPVAIDENELQARVYNLGQGKQLRISNVNRSADAISELFKSLGYFQVEVESEVKTDDSKYATVVFHIRPGLQSKVSKLQLTGDPKLELKKLLTRLESGVNRPFSSKALQRDLELIRKHLLSQNYLGNYIGQPALEYDPTTNTVAVSIEVNAGPLVEVKIIGAKLDQKLLRNKLGVFSGSGIDDFAIEESRRSLIQQLQLQGFFFAEATANVTGDANKVTITYEVDKGQRYRVGEISLIGTTLEYKQIASKLYSKRASGLSRGVTSSDYLKRDADTIVYTLRSLGYANARVKATRLGVSSGKEELIISFVVDEGPRTRLSEVVIEGNKTFTQKQLTDILPQTNYLTSEHIAAVEDAVRKFYDEHGYAEATVEAKAEQIDETKARLRISVEEGEQILIGKLLVTNQGRASARTIEKQLLFKAGELLKNSLIRQSEQRLYATGAFQRVSIQSEYQGRDEQGRAVHNVYVNTEETKPYTLVYSIGYQSEDSVRGLLQLSDTNFLGRLQTATLTLRASRREQLAQLSYQFRNPFELPISPLAIFFYRKRREAGFSSDRLTAIVQAEKQVNKNNEFILRYSFENVRTDNFSAVQVDRRDRSIRLGRLSITYLKDTRNNVIDAESGSFVTADLTLAASAIGGNRNYLRLFALNQTYRKLSERPQLVLATSVQTGLAKSFDESRRIPISERFFAGGSNSLRGFGFERAGPIRASTGLPSGGNAMIVFITELRFQIAGSLGGAAFYDTGNVFRKVSDIRLNKFSNTIGTGLRLKTPLGPIRLDVGMLINNRPNPLLPAEPRIRVHFNFGQAF
ncbi:MAG: POTRA domain-containing protein [Acidobacteriota bacterium]|nr:BamA/TamA family outer membrane protein [Blastocatellia bacterium]MDW8413631.1 POTRA domain-containing protein [Acidobacteriota bacterium]